MKTWQNVTNVRKGDTVLLHNQEHAVVRSATFEFDPEAHAPVVRLKFAVSHHGNPIEDTLVPVDHSVMQVTGCRACAAVRMVVSAYTREVLS